MHRVLTTLVGVLLVTSGLAIAKGTSQGVELVDILAPDPPGINKASSTDSGEDDADTGKDASDARAAPTRLPGKGKYPGRLSTSSDVDWFGLQPDSTTLCVEANVWSKTSSDVELSLPGLSESSALARVTAETDVHFGLAGSGISDIRLGMNPMSSAQRGAYKFDLQTFTPAELIANGDGASGGDAGATIHDAVPVTPGCLGGSLDASTDTGDMYAFEGTQGHRMIFSLVHAAGTAELSADVVAPDGTVAATLSDGDVTAVTLDQDGTWYLDVHAAAGSASVGSQALLFTSATVASSSEDYSVGISDDGPDPPPCAPGCSTL